MKKYLTTMFIAATLLSSCKNDQPAQETTHDDQEKAKREYFEQKRDSILHAHNADALDKSIDKNSSKKFALQSELDSLNNNSTYASKLAHEVEDIINNNLDAAIKNINDTYLAIFPGVQLNNGYKHTYHSDDPHDTEDINFYNNQEYPHPFVYKTVHISGLSQYGESRRNEIIEHVKSMLMDAGNQTINDAINAGKKYAKYYPILDIEKYIPAEYRKHFDQRDSFIENIGEGETAFGAGDIKYRRYIQLVRRVRVYDSKLKPEFFADNAYTYELVNVDATKWQVIKTHKNGNTEKTPVFSDNRTWETTPEYDATPEYLTQSNIDYNAGTNMGVHISATKALFQAIPEIENDTLPDPNNARKNRINQLNDSIQILSDQNHKLYDKKDKIKHLADSVACKMRDEYFSRQR